MEPEACVLDGFISVTELLQRSIGEPERSSTTMGAVVG